MSVDPRSKTAKAKAKHLYGIIQFEPKWKRTLICIELKKLSEKASLKELKHATKVSESSI